MSSLFIQANTNGRLHPATEPSVTPLNRGFLYGDAIYEVWRTYHGVVWAWEEHYERLQRSASALYLSLPWTREEMFAQVAQTAAAFRGATKFCGELYVRLQVSRGGGPIGLDIALADRADFVVLVQRCPASPTETRQRGLRLAVATTIRRNPVECLNPAWKTGNYLNNILGLREARARAADDVLMLNLHGEVTEAATSNVAFVRGNEIITPRLESGILAGVTRGIIIEQIAPAAGLHVREETIRPADFSALRECFLMSTTKDISPVAAIDDVRFTLGPATVTARLQAAFATHTQSVAAAHPEWKV